MYTVAFTGYRPEKMPFEESENDELYLNFRKQQLKVIKRLIEIGCTDFISGVAMGFDTWVAEDILELRKKNSQLRLECAIPCPEQDKMWARDDQKRRQKILKQANQATMVSEQYTKECFYTRNRYMVDNADVVVCAYDGRSGGTAYTVNYALNRNKIVIQINPSTAQVCFLSKRTFVE